jgi:hypothetical protein
MPLPSSLETNAPPKNREEEEAKEQGDASFANSVVLTYVI